MPQQSWFELLSPLPFHRRVAVVLGVLLMVGGMLWFKVAFSFVEMAWSFSALALGVIVAALSAAGYEPSSTKSRVQQRSP